MSGVPPGRKDNESVPGMSMNDTVNEPEKDESNGLLPERPNERLLAGETGRKTGGPTRKFRDNDQGMGLGSWSAGTDGRTASQRTRTSGA